MYAIYTIIHAFYTIITRNIAQKSPGVDSSSEFWAGISKDGTKITLKSPQNWLFWLKIVRKISNPTNFTE